MSFGFLQNQTIKEENRTFIVEKHLGEQRTDHHPPGREEGSQWKTNDKQ